MEGAPGWEVAERCLQKLIPYAREFDHVVKHEVLDTVMDVTGRTRQDMPKEVARLVDTVLLEVMPVGGGGFNYPATTPLSENDQELLKRIEHAAFEMTWDSACALQRLAEESA
jgi:hypothetical protein